ncbi:MAG: heavy metal-binding domain-containing protein [Bacteroidota bacterium]
MIITTTDQLETHQIIRYLGIVTGKANIRAKKLKEMRAAAQPELIDRAEKIAMEEAISKAEELGANALVGVTIDLETISGPYFYVLFTGTAVKCQRR